MMLSSVPILLSSAFALATLTVAVDTGQGTAQPGSNLAQLQAGSHLLGTEFDPSAQLGRIVVVEIGGS